MAQDEAVEVVLNTTYQRFHQILAVLEKVVVGLHLIAIKVDFKIGEIK